jgi:hypothetical protein
MSTERTIADVTGDNVVYRDLQPCTPHLTGLDGLRATLGLPADELPRKRDAAYARVMLELLRQAQAHRSDLPLQAVLVVGDSDNDRRLAHHLREASGLPVMAFIGADRAGQAPHLAWDGDSATATRWSLLDPWIGLVVQRVSATLHAMPWEQTALLLDIDKTLLGPRGRNDGAIDEARAEAALQEARDVLGDRLDTARFQSHYATLCEREYHSLTLDNQDYVAYLTLLLEVEALTLEDVQQGIADGSLEDFTALLARVEGHVPPVLEPLHAEICAAHSAGDPTTFKAFRRLELATTQARMADGRLMLGREVMDMAQRLVGRGALCLAASDKPAESALPSPQQESAGMLPLHRSPVQVA